MATAPAAFIVSRSARISAPAGLVYGIIADYRDGHPRILPPAFTFLTVEAGGVGAGTRIRCGLKVFGRVRTFVADISEPYPGRVLVERIVTEPTSVTTFTVEPVDAATSQVTIATEITSRRGPLGAIERLFARRLLEPLYTAELEKLDTVARARSSGTNA